MKLLTVSEKNYLARLQDKIQRNDVYAMEEYATFYTQNRPELMDAEKTILCISLYEKAVAAGVARAMLNLGALYYNGMLVPQDFKRARELYEEAVESDNGEIAAVALCNLGYLFYYARGVAKNNEKAYHCFLQGALLYQDPICLCKVGDMYYKGEHVRKDEAVAFKLYRQAENMCYKRDAISEVSVRLGRCLLYGNGERKDPFAALSYLFKAKSALYERQYRRKDPFAEGQIREVDRMIDHATIACRGE